MRILHITDFHYKGSKKASISSEIVDPVLSGLSEVKHPGIDLVLFSGDLVMRGDNPLEFDEAKNCLFNPILERLELDQDRIIITPG